MKFLLAAFLLYMALLLFLLGWCFLLWQHRYRKPKRTREVNMQDWTKAYVVHVPASGEDYLTRIHPGWWAIIEQPTCNAGDLIKFMVQTKTLQHGVVRMIIPPGVHVDGVMAAETEAVFGAWWKIVYDAVEPEVTKKYDPTEDAIKHLHTALSMGHHADICSLVVHSLDCDCWQCQVTLAIQLLQSTKPHDAIDTV